MLEVASVIWMYVAVSAPPDADSGSDVGSVIWICVGLVVLGGGGLLLSWYLRRRLMNPSNDSPAGGFSLEALRKLHREGKMSDAEFETTKALIAKLQSKQLNEPKPEKPAGSTKTGR